ncbi:hypothetical protein ASPTUDRAFT_41174 [Aspergillus tubingensis CBS 134.48]|uniref:Uncharacterized protein n=1 Tax=Aspergillus tubingensis (strain CBS 134.48) TaxID=767770 RepID=A0A1L9N6Y0_ASPTC|nr:hypothetical protein ASPTUDRAFT_41174 [Aspergillus tubingensis CBS 134.48]
MAWSKATIIALVTLLVTGPPSLLIFRCRWRRKSKRENDGRDTGHGETNGWVARRDSRYDVPRGEWAFLPFSLGLYASGTGIEVGI